tara:strand:- start:592 stop:957 length:366 start_codon:yes stop_codon:yes gene_type:complete
MSTLKVTNIQATGETASRPVSGVAAAWCNWDYTGTVLDSINTSSVTNNSTGNNTQSYTNSFSNAFYSYSGSVSYVRRYLCGAASTGDGSNQLSGSTRTAVYTDSGSISQSHTSTKTHGDLA